MVPCALVALGYGALAWPSPFNANDTVVDPSEQLPAPLRRTASPENWACRLTAGQPLVVGRLAGAHAPFVGHVNVALCDPVLPLKENCHVWLVEPAAWAVPATAQRPTVKTTEAADARYRFFTLTSAVFVFSPQTTRVIGHTGSFGRVRYPAGCFLGTIR
jgi:hypothetical protein